MLSIVLATALGATGTPRFDVVYRELPNLVYQLDCVSGVAPSCSKDAFLPLWSRELLQSADDRLALVRWKKLHEKYNGSISFNGDEKPPLGSRARFSLEARVRIAGLLANSVDDFVNRIDVLALPGDRAQFVEIIRRFEPRFRQWWAPQSKAGQRFAGELKSTLARPEVVALFSSFRTFYGAELSDDRPLPFVIIDRPESEGNKTTYGEQIDGVSVLEVLPKEKANARLDVAIHELCHFFFFSVPLPLMTAVQQRFIESKAPGAFGAYRLFDEAVATALGNGLAQRLVNPPEYERRLAKKQGFYNDRDIDRAAKALLPFLERWLKQSGTLHDEMFVDEYLSALEKDYGAELGAPRLAMFDLLLFEDDELPGEMGATLRNKAHISSFSRVKGRVDEPDVVSWFNDGMGLPVFIVKPQHVAQLTTLSILSNDDVRQLAQLKAPYLFTKQRPGKEAVTLIVVDDAEAANKGLQHLVDALSPLVGVQQL